MISGQVIGISDGDTITVLVDKQPINVRIAEIAVPESRQALPDLCYRVVAEVEEVSRDRYGARWGVRNAMGNAD